MTDASIVPNASKNQATLGGDAGVTAITAWYAAVAGAPSAFPTHFYQQLMATAYRAGTTNEKHKVSSSFCSGLGPWQNQEIQALFSQFVKPEVSRHSGGLVFGQDNAGSALDAGGRNCSCWRKGARLPPNRLQRTRP